MLQSHVSSATQKIMFNADVSSWRSSAYAPGEVLKWIAVSAYIVLASELILNLLAIRSTHITRDALDKEFTNEIMSLVAETVCFIADDEKKGIEQLISDSALTEIEESAFIDFCDLLTSAHRRDDTDIVSNVLCADTFQFSTLSERELEQLIGQCVRFAFNNAVVPKSINRPSLSDPVCIGILLQSFADQLSDGVIEFFYKTH